MYNLQYTASDGQKFATPYLCERHERDIKLSQLYSKFKFRKLNPCIKYGNSLIDHIIYGTNTDILDFTREYGEFNPEKNFIEDKGLKNKNTPVWWCAITIPCEDETYGYIEIEDDGSPIINAYKYIPLKNLFEEITNAQALLLKLNKELSYG